MFSKFKNLNTILVNSIYFLANIKYKFTLIKEFYTLWNLMNLQNIKKLRK